MLSVSYLDKMIIMFGEDIIVVIYGVVGSKYLELIEIIVECGELLNKNIGM